MKIKGENLSQNVTWILKVFLFFILTSSMFLLTANQDCWILEEAFDIFNLDSVDEKIRSKMKVII